MRVVKEGTVLLAVWSCIYSTSSLGKEKKDPQHSIKISRRDIHETREVPSLTRRSWGVTLVAVPFLPAES